MVAILMAFVRSLILAAAVAATGAGLFLSGLGLGVGLARPPRLPAAPLPGPAASDEPILGLQFEALTPELARLDGLTIQTGAIVRALAAGGLAERAGLQLGDVILSVNALPIDAHHTLDAVIVAQHTGGTLTLDVWRDGADVTIRVDLNARPDDVQS